MAWPSTLSSFTDPNATDKLNSPSHSSIETAQNTALEELQAYLGVTTGATASAVGTLLYDVKAPDSNGGGHVQTANKGGTGQTTFTKGDMLVASSSSVISKLAVGSDTFVLEADSTAASGVKWAQKSNNRVIVIASQIGVATAETSIFSSVITGSTLGTANAIRTTAFLTNWATRDGRSVLTAVQYGGQTVASVMLNPVGTDTVGYGTLTHTMMGNNSATNQRHILEINYAMKPSGNATYPDSITFNADNGLGSVATILRTVVTNTSSINSSANQTLGITSRIYDANSSQTYSGVIVEKII